MNILWFGGAKARAADPGAERAAIDAPWPEDAFKDLSRKEIEAMVLLARDEVANIERCMAANPTHEALDLARWQGGIIAMDGFCRRLKAAIAAVDGKDKATTEAGKDE